jgi:hypothetical protein
VQRGEAMDVGPEDLGRRRRDDFQVRPGHGYFPIRLFIRSKNSKVCGTREGHPMAGVATIYWRSQGDICRHRRRRTAHFDTRRVTRVSNPSPSRGEANAYTVAAKPEMQTIHTFGVEAPHHHPSQVW